MHIYTYNLFDDPIPKSIDFSNPISFFIKGQKQSEDDFKVKNRWTNTFRHICYYLYYEQSSHLLFTNLIDEKYSKSTKAIEIPLRGNRRFDGVNGVNPLLIQRRH